jgi:hypothetical protein
MLLTTSQRGVRGEQFAQMHESTYDVDAHLDGARAVQDGGGHDGAVFGEHVGRKSRIAVLLGTGRNLRPVQSLGLGSGEPEHEIFREARGVALDLLVQALGGDAIEACEFRIQEHALAAQDEDGTADVVNRHKSWALCLSHGNRF